MLTAAMHVDLPVTGTLEDLLEAWASPERTATEGVCVVCAGETLRIELRGGAHAHACRECGSVLETPAA